MTKEKKFRTLEEIKEASKTVYSYRELSEKLGITCKTLFSWLEGYFSQDRDEIEENLKANNKKRKKEEKLKQLKHVSSKVSSFKELAVRTGIKNPSNWIYINFPEEITIIKTNLETNRKNRENKEQYRVISQRMEEIKDISKKVFSFKELTDKVGIPYLYENLAIYFPKEKNEIKSNLKANREKKNNEKMKQNREKDLEILERIKALSKIVSTFKEISEEVGISNISVWLIQNFPEEKAEIKANLAVKKGEKYNERKRQKQNEKLIRLEEVKTISMRVSTFDELSQEIGISTISNWLERNFPEEKAKIKANIEANKLKKKEKIEREYLELARIASKRAYSFTEIADEIKINITALKNSLKKFPEIDEEIRNNISTNKAKKDKFELDEIELRDNHMIFHTRENSIAEVWRFYHSSPRGILKQNQSIEIERGDCVLVAQYDPIINCIVIMEYEIYLENSKIVKVKFRDIQDDMRLYYNKKIQAFANRAKEVLDSKIK